jgi:hypothetical protein
LRAGRTDERINTAFPKAPIIRLFETEPRPNLLIIKGAIGEQTPQTIDIRARL